MSTLLEIQIQMGRAINYEIRKMDDPAIKIFSTRTDTHMIFTNGEKAILSDSGWELVKSPGLAPIDKQKAKRRFILDLIDEFEAENINYIDKQIWPQSYIGEMLSNALILKIVQLAPLGVVRSIRDIWTTIPTNETWLTTIRHQKYLDLLNEGIMRFSI